MSTPNIAPASVLTISSVLGRARRILFAQPFIFLALAFIALLPSMLTSFLGAEREIKSLGALLDFILMMITQGAFAYGVFQIFTGKSASFGAALSRGMTRFFPIVGAVLLISLFFVLVSVLSILPGVLLRSSWLLPLGLLLCLLFLFPWIHCGWVVAIPACTVERLGPIRSLERSWELTKGYRWKILGLMTVAYLIFFVFLFAAVFAYSLLLAFLGLSIDSLPAVLGFVLILTLPVAFINVVYTTLYYDLRSVKEGVAVDSLVNVFD